MTVKNLAVAGCRYNAEQAPQSLVGSDWILGFGNSITKIGNYVYIGTGLFGVEIIDVSDPSNPIWVDSICVGDLVVDVSSAGGLLMVSGLSGEVELYSVQPDGEAVKAGSYQTYLWIEDTAFYGDKMYVMGWNGVVEVVDLDNISDPQNLTLLTTGGRKEVSMRLGHDFAVIPGNWYGINIYDIEPVNGQDL